MNTFAKILLVSGGIFSMLACLSTNGNARQQGYTQSVTTVDASKPFTAVAGRFSIALPENVGGARNISSKTSSGIAEGHAFTWQMTEGQFGVTYVDRPEHIDNSNASQVLSEVHDAILAQAKSAEGIPIKDEPIQASYPADELRFDLPQSISIFRLYLAGNRLYQVLLNVPKVEMEQLDVAVKVLDTFRILSSVEADALIKKKIAEATPADLPQQPVAKKPKTDAEDTDLKGKVKTVATEVENLDRKTFAQRRPTGTQYYNKDGNLTKREVVDYYGNLWEIVVYGYLDGDRVEKSGTVHYEYQLPTKISPESPTAKRDERYSMKHKYRYDEKGRLLEDLFFFNNGKVAHRDVYDYQGNEVEELVIGTDGAVNQKYVDTLDAKGEVKQRRIYDPKLGSVRDTLFYTYEYDAKGNWVKRTDSRLVTVDGKSQPQASVVIHRTITYY